LAARFPQLEILELLGQGGMGAVYKARQPRLDRIVAVKVLPAEWSNDPAFAGRFAREARALARLTHPHVVAVFDFGESDSLFYFVMEYVDGINLRSILQERRLSPPEALTIIPQVCEALQYAHEEGVVHRDIKPENILLDRKGRVKIADFGLAKLLDRPAAGSMLTGSQQVMGTPHYMAPEQIDRPREVDHRADIYSLGVVFYEMLTGELPLGRFAPPSEKAAIDGRLDEVVLRTLEREPHKRYQHASDVKSEVEAICRHPMAPTVRERVRAEPTVIPSPPITGAAERFGTVSIVATIACIVGASTVFMPWVRVRVWGLTQMAAGFDRWHGIVTASAFALAAILILVFGLIRPRALPRSLAMMVAGILGVVLPGLFIWDVTQPPPQPPTSLTPNLPFMKDLAEPLMNSVFGQVQSVLSPEVTTLVGPYVAMTLGVVLFVLGGVQLLRLGRRAPAASTRENRATPAVA
jgi:predicted Ser/Thr protein kinase